MIDGYVGTDPVEKIYLGTELVWPLGPAPTPPPYEEQYFTVEAVSAGTFNIRKPTGLYYSLNGGAWTAATTSMNLSAGDKVRFKGDQEDIVPSQMFSGNTMDFKVYGNIMSLGYPDDFSVNSLIPESSYFSSMFRGSTGLVDASNLILPTGVTNFCYQEMFSSCSNLVKAPELPAETLSIFCYFAMFYGCTSLIYIKCLATDISATNCTLNWVSGITTDGVFVQASATGWIYGVSGIPETWFPVGAPQHDDGLWVQFSDGESGDLVDDSGTTEDMGATYTFPELINHGYVSNISLFSDGRYVFLDEVDICGYNCSDSECSVICGGEGGDDGEGNYIECNIMTGDTRFIIPTYQVMDITYTPASNMLSIQTHAEECGGDHGCCWDTRDPAVYKLCGCDFEGLLDQMVATWSDMDGGEWNLYIRYADDKDYYGEVVDGNGDTYAEIIFNRGDEEEIPVSFDNSVVIGFDTDEDCLEIHALNGDDLENVYGFSLVAPSTCLCQICQDWEEKGYSNREECVCQEYYGGDCPDCMENWYEMGYESYEDCIRHTYGECPTDCSDWENMGYSSYEECDCAENGNCEEGE